MQQEQPERKWTSVRIEKVTSTVDNSKNQHPQWELTVRWEWTAASNQWGDKVWVYKESAPKVIEPGIQNVLVERGVLKRNKDGDLHDGSYDWMYRYKIVGWESMQGTAQPQLQPSAPVEEVAPVQPDNVQHIPAEVIPENQMRIMRQSTLHYAAILMAPIVKDFSSPQVMVERTIDLSSKLLHYAISGEMPTFGDPEEHDDLLDHEV